jgi:hypothetical protein
VPVLSWRLANVGDFVGVSESVLMLRACGCRKLDFTSRVVGADGCGLIGRVSGASRLRRTNQALAQNGAICSETVCAEVVAVKP